MHKGYLMGSLARYTECWSLLHQAEHAARELGLRTLVGEALWRRGMISIFAGDYASAATHLQSAFKIALGKEPATRGRRNGGTGEKSDVLP